MFEGKKISQIKAQTNLMNAEAAKAYADANKTRGVDTDKTRQDIAESETRIDEIIAKIPSVKQQYYIGKAHEEALKASKLLTEASAAKTDEERKVLAIQQHVLFKEVDKMVTEIEGVSLDNDQKKIIKNSLQRSIDSQIYLNTAQAIAAEANANFSNESIRTSEGQLQLWSKQAKNWEGQAETVLDYHKHKQWEWDFN